MKNYYINSIKLFLGLNIYYIFLSNFKYYNKIYFNKKIL